MRFFVEVCTTTLVAVDGEDFNEACELAGKHACRVLAAGGLLTTDVTDVLVRSEPPAPEVKTVTYTCTNCKETSLKADFGPGWIRCPHCKQVGTGITSS